MKPVACAPLAEMTAQLQEAKALNHALLNCSLRSVFDVVHGEFDLRHLIDERVLEEGNAA